MVSLCYNSGPGAFSRSTLVKRFNAGNIEGAAEALTWFNKAGGKKIRGIVRRREAERTLFLSDENHVKSPMPPVRGEITGGEHKPVTKSKTAGTGILGAVTAGLAAWAQFKETAPEVVESVGPYAGILALLVCGFVIWNRYRESAVGEH